MFESIDPLVNGVFGILLNTTFPSLSKLTYLDVKNFRVTCCEMQFPRIHGTPISYTATRLSNYYAHNVQPSNQIRRRRFCIAFTSLRNPLLPSCLLNEVHNEILHSNLLNNNFFGHQGKNLLKTIAKLLIVIAG